MRIKISSSRVFLDLGAGQYRLDNARLRARAGLLPFEVCELFFRGKEFSPFSSLQKQKKKMRKSIYTLIRIRNLKDKITK